jgi:hypothetical protein
VKGFVSLRYFPTRNGSVRAPFRRLQGGEAGVARVLMMGELKGVQIGIRRGDWWQGRHCILSRLWPISWMNTSSRLVSVGAKVQPVSAVTRVRVAASAPASRPTTCKVVPKGAI